MLKENRHILELKNQVVDSYDKDDDIFEPEKRFSRFFNTFVSQWCVKNVFKLAFRFHVCPEIPEMLGSHAFKKFNFQHYGITKTFFLKKLKKNQKNCNIKMHPKILGVKISCLKVNYKQKLEEYFSCYGAKPTQKLILPKSL